MPITDTLPTVHCGRYSAGPSPDPRTSGTYYVTTPNPLGNDHAPHVLATTNSLGLAIQLAAALNLLQVARSVLPALDEASATPTARHAYTRLAQAVSLGRPG